MYSVGGKDTTYSKFWENVFNNLGFEKTTILEGRTAFKIPIYEAIYMSQIMGRSNSTDLRLRAPCKVVILTKDGKPFRFPTPCPSVHVENIFIDSMDLQLNPLLSPSLNLIKKIVPEFFSSKEKYLLFENDTKILEEIKAEGLNPTDFILFRGGYHYSESLYLDEDAMTYITSSFLRGRGFIVDKFSEKLTVGPGSPDLFAIKIPHLQNELIDLKITSGGFYLNELELLDVLGEREAEHTIEETKSIVIEVESPGSGRFSAGRRQVLEYLSYGCYNEGYVAIPFEEKRVKTTGECEEFIPFEDVGIITLSKEGEIILKNCSKSYGEKRKIKELLKNVERIVKLTLLKNLPLRKAFNLLPDVHSFYDLYFAIDKVKVDEIIAFIKE